MVNHTCEGTRYVQITSIMKIFCGPSRWGLFYVHREISQYFELCLLAVRLEGPIKLSALISTYRPVLVTFNFPFIRAKHPEFRGSKSSLLKRH